MDLVALAVSLPIAAVGIYYLVWASTVTDLQDVEGVSINRLRVRLRRLNGLLLILMGLAMYLLVSRSMFLDPGQRPGIVGPIALAGGQGLGFHPVWLALAIGCGSKPIMWMNDSGFWIIGKMSGFTEGETLKTASVMMIVMAVTGLAIVMLGAWWFPLT